ncbi:hypothetical protein D9K90_23095 [Klebsiella pneumoniae]|nr:hypothetical protein D9K90_23095 [Klebsiella pneumoniae]
MSPYLAVYAEIYSLAKFIIYIYSLRAQAQAQAQAQRGGPGAPESPPGAPLRHMAWCRKRAAE